MKIYDIFNQKPAFIPIFTEIPAKFMHELSIAMSVVDAIIETAGKEKATRINAFTLEVGTLSGVDFESLEFALQSAVLETSLENVPFRIDRVEALAKCTACMEEFILEELYSACPVCGAYNPSILAGKELKIKSIEIED
jgi:hydrogenase nickel incorporation protein HypA/HybF